MRDRYTTDSDHETIRRELKDPMFRSRYQSASTFNQAFREKALMLDPEMTERQRGGFIYWAYKQLLFEFERAILHNVEMNVAQVDRRPLPLPDGFKKPSPMDLEVIMRIVIDADAYDKLTSGPQENSNVRNGGNGRGRGRRGGRGRVRGTSSLL